MDMWQERGQALDPSWTKQWDGGRGGETENKKGDLKRRVGEKKDSAFSLNFLEIGTVVSSGARGRVQPHSKGFA